MNAQNSFNTNSEQLFQQGGSKWNLDRIPLVLAVLSSWMFNPMALALAVPHIHMHKLDVQSRSHFKS